MPPFLTSSFLVWYKLKDDITCFSSKLSAMSDVWTVINKNNNGITHDCCCSRRRFVQKQHVSRGRRIQCDTRVIIYSYVCIYSWKLWTGLRQQLSGCQWCATTVFPHASLKYTCLNSTVITFAFRFVDLITFVIKFRVLMKFVVVIVDCRNCISVVNNVVVSFVFAI
jgi:hypothetical protein